MDVLEKILEEIGNLNYYPEGMGCGIEDCGITDRYEACEYGWNKAIEAVVEAISNMRETISEMGTVEKEKVTSAEIISREIDGKAYYEIKFKKVGKDEYTIGYSSFKLDYVVKWLNDYFEFAGEAKVSCENGGWIPVEERMPEEHNSMFAKFKSTQNWSNAMFEKMSDEVNVTIELEDGTRKTTTSYTLDGKWKVEKEQQVVKKKVIAWQPLPEPYKGGEDRWKI